jgi:hypothetical protein
MSNMKKDLDGLLNYKSAPRAAEAVEDDTYERIGVFQRTAELDKSIKDGDKFDGDAWTVWIRIGAVPDGSLGKSMFEDLTPNLSHAEKIWRCKTCGVEQDSFGPVTPAEPVSSRPAPAEVAEGAGIADQLERACNVLQPLARTDYLFTAPNAAPGCELRFSTLRAAIAALRTAPSLSREEWKVILLSMEFYDDRASVWPAGWEALRAKVREAGK